MVLRERCSDAHRGVFEVFCPKLMYPEPFDVEHPADERYDPQRDQRKDGHKDYASIGQIHRISFQMHEPEHEKRHEAHPEPAFGRDVKDFDS